MSNQWVKDEDAPGKEDKYEWRLPENGDQHGEQTVAPGDLLIKPKDLRLVPTIAPKRSGVQHGQWDYTIHTFVDTGTWYSFGSITQED